MSLPESPFNAVPAHAWLLLALAITAAAPAIYVFRYLMHDRSPRDITQPPEDASWKSKRILVRCCAALAVILAIAIFSFTPQAAQFAESQWFVPSLMGALGSYAVSTVIPGWRDRKIEPLIRGIYETYHRDSQPIRYWSSLVWNAVSGIGLLVMSTAVLKDNITPQCEEPETNNSAELSQALATCQRLAGGANAEDRQENLATQGRIFQRMKKDEEAIRTYTAALALDPEDSYSLYNRGYLLLRSGKPEAAIADFNASLALRPDNSDAYVDRGLAHFALKQNDLADRDFAKVAEDSPALPMLLAQRADFAIERGELDTAIVLASKAIDLDPRNTFALRLRSEAYWKKGDEARSQADDDGVRRIEGFDVR